jgi:hypothetical protein
MLSCINYLKVCLCLIDDSLVKGPSMYGTLRKHYQSEDERPAPPHVAREICGLRIEIDKVACHGNVKGRSRKECNQRHLAEMEAATRKVDRIWKETSERRLHSCDTTQAVYSKPVTYHACLVSANIPCGEISLCCAMLLFSPHR